MAATWSDDAEPESLAGATVTLNVSYVAAARGQDLTAVAVVSKRGRSMVFSDVRVTEPDGRLVATGIGRPALRVMSELSRLAASELAALPRGIADIHSAISGRVFRALGPRRRAGAPRPRHDRARQLRGRQRRPVAGCDRRRLTALKPDPESPRTEMVIAALNGLYGDRLEAQGSELAIPMQVRSTGERARTGHRGLPARPRRDRVRVGLAAATASGSRAGRRCSSATTPAAISQKMVRRWPNCSTSSSRSGRWRFGGSR